MLGHSRDYHRVIEYASRALSLEPGIQDAYYWRDELPEEEYLKVQHLLEIRTDTTE